MKKFLTTFVFIGLMAMAAFAQDAVKTNFAGTWTLDKAKSGELPRNLQNVEKIEWTVTHGEKEINVKGLDGETQTYKLDGKESDVEFGGRMAGKGKAVAALDKDGKLEINTNRTVTVQGTEISIKIKDVYELADAGKTLKVKRTTETPRGTQSYDLVFAKK